MDTWTAFSALLGLYLTAACAALALVTYFMALTERRAQPARVRATPPAHRPATSHRRTALSHSHGTAVRGTAPTLDGGRHPTPRARHRRAS
ncbi:hypothetical protein JOF41_005032 [Saccharothrix coeruleofusca]|nr:hypothetical protein [Saccharothrix coeruleofusca]